MLILLTTIHISVCLFLILVVLLQQGKGADLSVFGGGSTQAVFGARGAATLLHKLTVGAFVAFIVTTIGIGLVTTGGGGSSVMSDVPSAAAETEDAEADAAGADESGVPADDAESADPAAPATDDATVPTPTGEPTTTPAENEGSG